MIRTALVVACVLAASSARADFRLQSDYFNPAPTGMQESSVSQPQNTLHGVTVGLMVGVVVGLIVWDVIVAREGGHTESRIIMDAAWQYSSVPYALGVLVGHWLFTHESARNTNMWPVMVASLAAVLVWDLVKQGDAHAWTRYPGLWFGLGVPVGALFWGQRHAE